MINKIKENKLLYGVILILIVIFAIGGVFTDYVVTQRAEEIIVDEERYYDEVTLTNLEYNFDKDTLGQKTYIATFIYDGLTYKSYVDHTFCFVELIEGEALDLMVHSAVKHHAEQEELLQNTAYIVSYNEATKTLVITADGFAGSGSISVEFVLTDELAVSSYTVTSSESYKSDYNEGYTDGSVPFVENNMIDQYVAGNATIDAVAGASEGTGDAMQELIALLDLFLDSMEGGN
ncbi:MAG: hypothetical protein JEZ05_06995 [Tenericutes bacterium]|nr:hypothetical protein [Mycoplasmatota bacterium]